mmetsp:Transcript_18749/g.54138  ORF Transcript_18749/g.54138 Transcript_18749/m.54138 type:complete len:476 (+) Transcript_18749:40-1467(+)
MLHAVARARTYGTDRHEEEKKRQQQPLPERERRGESRRRHKKSVLKEGILFSAAPAPLRTFSNALIPSPQLQSDPTHIYIHIYLYISRPPRRERHPRPLDRVVVPPPFARFEDHQTILVPNAVLVSVAALALVAVLVRQGIQFVQQVVKEHALLKRVPQRRPPPVRSVRVSPHLDRVVPQPDGDHAGAVLKDHPQVDSSSPGGGIAVVPDELPRSPRGSILPPQEVKGEGEAESSPLDGFYGKFEERMNIRILLLLFGRGAVFGNCFFVLGVGDVPHGQCQSSRRRTFSFPFSFALPLSFSFSLPLLPLGFPHGQSAVQILHPGGEYRHPSRPGTDRNVRSSVGGTGEIKFSAVVSVVVQVQYRRGDAIRERMVSATRIDRDDGTTCGGFAGGPRRKRNEFVIRVVGVGAVTPPRRLLGYRGEIDPEGSGAQSQRPLGGRPRAFPPFQQSIVLILGQYRRSVIGGRTGDGGRAGA